MSQEIAILNILSDLVIFLFSITIPTYAIAVSLLGSEYSKMVEKITADKQKLENELQNPSKTLKLEETEKKIEEFRKKEKKLKSRFNPLSLYPTIVFPDISFGIALIIILTDMYVNAQLFDTCLVLISIFIILGLAILGNALNSIQKAATESKELIEQK
jgi:hypothetical protein